MKFIEDTLENLDNYFEGRKESEFYIIVVGILFLFGYLSYGMLIPMSEKVLKRDLMTKRTLESTIRGHEKYLSSITVNGDRRYKIKLLQNDIQRLKNEFKDTRELNEYFDFQIQTLSEMLFNEKNWAKFLDSITKEAKKHHVRITLLSNKFIDNKKSFGHVLEIGIECEGSYKNLLAFINAIEESNLVVDIYDINIEGGKKISSAMKVSVWGINY
ncbi:MAG: type 4a pilus biogenesis protein PilO [Epsilonproteobacteria bacterium]|nr:type 4a pilus biogenesis protein PilO [Campylobacterota bacterium]